MTVRRARALGIDDVRLALLEISRRLSRALDRRSRVLSINRDHSDQTNPVAEDRILEQLLLCKVSRIPPDVRHHQRDFDEALMIWREDVSLILLEMLGPPDLDLDPYKPKPNPHKHSNRIVDHVLVAGYQQQSNQEWSQHRDRGEPETEQEETANP